MSQQPDPEVLRRLYGGPQSAPAAAIDIMMNALLARRAALDTMIILLETERDFQKATAPSNGREKDAT